MKKTVWLVFISVLLLFLMIQEIGPANTERVPAPFPFSSPKRETGNMRFVINSTVRFINQGTNVWNLTEEERSIDLFMNNSWQTVILINHSHPLEKITEDDDGNTIAVLDLPKHLEPREEVSYSVSYHVLSKPATIPDLQESTSGKIEDIPETLSAIYCVSQQLLPIENEEIRETAFDIVANETNVVKIISKFVAWIWENIRYPSLGHEVPFYPDETLETKEGDCDEQAMLFATFCRIYGIPSFIQVGCGYLPQYYANETHWSGKICYEFTRIGWHGWAMVFVPPWGWLPVDLTFVKAGLDDPLNAVKFGAVTFQEFVQCANVSRTDYVDSSKTYRHFLIQNDFCLYLMDEMTRTFSGDLNCDFTVTIQDIETVVEAFGSRPMHQKWNPIADLDENDLINIVDVALVARELGKKL